MIKNFTYPLSPMNNTGKNKKSWECQINNILTCLQLKIDFYFLVLLVAW